MGENLDFKEMKNNFKFEPTYLHLKGEPINSKYKYGSKEYEEDSWLYEVEFNETQNINDVMFDFINIVIEHKDYLKKLSEKNYVRLWCDIYSDYAQLGFSFFPETCQRINELGIGIDIQIYSEGKV
jgi:hypothetical protein